MSDIATTSYLATPTSTRSRSSSQPQQRPRALSNSMKTPTSPGKTHGRSLSRNLSTNAIQKATSSGFSVEGHHHHGSDDFGTGGSSAVSGSPGGSGTGAEHGKRRRSSSLVTVTVTQVGGDQLDHVVDRLGMGVNENANWVNAPGAWLIHPFLILFGKVLVDSIPNMTPSYSWTIVNIGYVLISFTMFHLVTGIPFETSHSSGGAYDDLTLWEQIDAGAQYTPAKKWLTSVPILLFLISTHYVKYDPKLFCLNFVACLFVLFPKLPALHRLRFHITSIFMDDKGTGTGANTPVGPGPSHLDRPSSPHLQRMGMLDPIMEKDK